MDTKVLRQRMYHLVIYQLSGIQAGIQAGHAKDAYSILFGKDKEYQQWLKWDKTVIILNGGTTNSGGDYVHFVNDNVPNIPKGSSEGTIQKYYLALINMNVKVEPFYEPDLNDAMTAIAFLVDERVWDRETYPEYPSGYRTRTGDPNTDMLMRKEALADAYGKQTAELRIFLEQFQPARN